MCAKSEHSHIPQAAPQLILTWALLCPETLPVKCFTLVESLSTTRKEGSLLTIIKCFWCRPLNGDLLQARRRIHTTVLLTRHSKVTDFQTLFSPTRQFLAARSLDYNKTQKMPYYNKLKAAFTLMTSTLGIFTSAVCS